MSAPDPCPLSAPGPFPCPVSALRPFPCPVSAPRPGPWPRSLPSECPGPAPCPVSAPRSPHPRTAAPPVAPHGPGSSPGRRPREGVGAGAGVGCGRARAARRALGLRGCCRRRFPGGSRCPRSGESPGTGHLGSGVWAACAAGEAAFGPRGTSPGALPPPPPAKLKAAMFARSLVPAGSLLCSGCCHCKGKSRSLCLRIFPSPLFRAFACISDAASCCGSLPRAADHRGAV